MFHKVDSLYFHWLGISVAVKVTSTSKKILCRESPIPYSQSLQLGFKSWILENIHENIINVGVNKKEVSQFLDYNF